jgi:transposase-like protein
MSRQFGLKNKYNKDKCKKAYDLILSGAKIFQVAEGLDISRETFYQWRIKHKEFADIIEKALSDYSDEVYEEVRIAYRKKITGYDYTETETIRELDKNNQPVKTKIKQTKKHIPPDTTLLIFEKKHRDPRYKENLSAGENKENTIFLPDSEESDLIEKLWNKISSGKLKNE